MTEDTGKRENSRSCSERGAEERGLGEKTTYINNMMDGGRGLSTIPNRQRNAQELQGDWPGLMVWGAKGGTHLTIRRPRDEREREREAS